MTSILSYVYVQYMFQLSRVYTQDWYEILLSRQTLYLLTIQCTPWTQQSLKEKTWLNKAKNSVFSMIKLISVTSVLRHYRSPLNEVLSQFFEIILTRKLLTQRQSCHHIETSKLICRANRLTGFYMMDTLAFKELSNFAPVVSSNTH